MKERKLGEIWTTKKGITLEVQLCVMGNSCRKCYYNGKEKCERALCTPSERSENNEVIFKDITDELRG